MRREQFWSLAPRAGQKVVSVSNQRNDLSEFTIHCFPPGRLLNPSFPARAYAIQSAPATTTHCCEKREFRPDLPHLYPVAFRFREKIWNACATSHAPPNLP